MSIFGNFLNFIADTLFPKNCLNCYKEGFWICPDCLLKIKKIDSFSCPVCQKRLPAPLDDGHLAAAEGKICQECRAKTKLSRFFGAFSYEDPLIKTAIHKLKYGFIKDLASPLSLPIINFLKQFNFDSDFLIVPVPLYRTRERWRGFNQSTELAKEISKTLKISLISNNLVKIKNTQPQVEINDFQERKENIQGAFRVKNPEKFSGKKVILVDDVYTTGSTMEEFAKALKRAGVKEIWGMVIAK